MQQVLDTKPTSVEQAPTHPQQQQRQQQQKQQEQKNQQPTSNQTRLPPQQTTPQPGQRKPPPPPLPLLQPQAHMAGTHLLQQQQQQQLLQQLAQSQPMQAQQLFSMHQQPPRKPQTTQPRAKAPQPRAEPPKRGKSRKKQPAPQPEGYYPQYLAERHFPSSKDPLKITVQVELDGKKQDESYPATLTIKHCFDNYFSYFLDLPKELRARIRKADIKGWDQVDELTIRISLASFKSADATPAASSLGNGQLSPSALASTTSTSAAAQAATLTWPPASAPAAARASRSALPTKPGPATGSPTSMPARASPTDPYNPTALDPSTNAPFPLPPHLQAAAAASATLNPTPDALSSLLLAQQFSTPDPSAPAPASHLDLLLKNPHLASNPAATAAAFANLKAATLAAAGFSLGPFRSPSSFAPADLDPSTSTAAATAAALNPLSALFPQLLAAGPAPPADPQAATLQALARLPSTPDTAPPYDEQNSKRIRYSEGLPQLNSTGAPAAPDPTSPVPSATTPNTLAMRSLTGGPALHLQHPALPDDDTLDGASWERYMTAMLDAPADKLWPPGDPSTTAFDAGLMHHPLPTSITDFLQPDSSFVPPLASPRLPDIPPLQTGLSHLAFPGPAPSPTTRQLDLAAAAHAKDLSAALSASQSPMLSALHKHQQPPSPQALTAQQQHGPQSPSAISGGGGSGGSGSGGALCDASTMVAELLHMVGYLKPSFKDRLLLMVALQKADMQQLAGVHLAMKGAWDKKSIQQAHEIFGQLMETNQIPQLRTDGVDLAPAQVQALSFPVILPGVQGAANLQDGLLEVLTFCQASAQLQADVLLAVQRADDLQRQVINTGLVDACVRRSLDDLKGVIYSIINS